ncbi:IS110 family transposase [Teredinibacter haidensis]|uniref:IS110 family transposase n=1 Tax=Teredinibacter haidensis TaxID=2731755 RepID=UPI0009490CD6|nr:IS110 family transposase [Teredinibacter haidensis]
MKRQLLEAHDEFFRITDHCDQIKQELIEVVRSNPLCQRLITLPGIGIIIATALYSAIGNAGQFSYPRELPVWLGVTPKQFSSGDKSVNGSITKRGNRYLRKQLIHGARSVLYRSKLKTDKLSVWVNNLVERRGVNKAAVALANRLARLIWVILQRGVDYKIIPA